MKHFVDISKIEHVGSSFGLESITLGSAGRFCLYKGKLQLKTQTIFDKQLCYLKCISIAKVKLL